MKSGCSKEFNDFCSRAAGAVAAATAGLASDGSTDLKVAYRSAIRFVFSLLGAFILESRGIRQAGRCCEPLRRAITGEGNWDSAWQDVAEYGRSTGVDLLKAGGGYAVPAKHARAALRALLLSEVDPAMGMLCFSTVPAGWISLLYESLLDRCAEVSPDPPGIILRSDSSSRKRNGAFFTPGYIIDYIVEESISKADKPQTRRVLDPSMGAGDFLVSALRHLSAGQDSAAVAEACIYGCDIDPVAVDIARFLLWLETGGRAHARTIGRHLICADAIAADGKFSWDEAFPDAFGLFSGDPGFDAVIGNPPYVAAKNVALGGYQAAHGVKGQSDYYLIFLQSVLANRLVRPGGSLAMVLPDPFLVRANAAKVRRALLEKWTVKSVVHVAGAFPGAHVGNIILVSVNRPTDGRPFPVLRLENTPDRRSFELDPKLAVTRQATKIRPSFALAQPRAEALYLIDDGYKATFQRIHGPESSLAKIVAPFVCLNDLDIVERIFRGEEIGKRKIAESTGELPILLGGESIRNGRIVWDGSGISQEAVSKPLGWYEAPKIILQKSSARVTAAYDDKGFVVPQSVYGIKLREGRYSPLYLLALLNSRFMTEYVVRAFTGYKMVQPQIELEDVRRLPIRAINFDANPVERAKLAAEAIREYDREMREGSGSFAGLMEMVERMIAKDHTDAVHDVLAHIGTFAYLPRHEEYIAAESERLDRVMNLIVDASYGSNSGVG